jgi:hypothetical protein
MSNIIECVIDLENKIIENFTDLENAYFESLIPGDKYSIGLIINDIVVVNVVLTNEELIYLKMNNIKKYWVIDKQKPMLHLVIKSQIL